jgi:hypothetical protein
MGYFQPNSTDPKVQAFQQRLVADSGRSPQKPSAPLSSAPATAQSPVSGSAQPKPRRRGTVLTDPLGLTPESGPSKTLLTA